MNKNENKTTEQRRKALKKILVGTGAAGVVASAPEKWTTPLVNSVTLPAHATTSVPLSFTLMNITQTPAGGLQELLVPTANAGILEIPFYDICVVFNADMTTYSARVVFFSRLPVEAVGVGGTIGTPLALEYACGDDVNLFLTVDSGPSAAGVPFSLCDGIDIPFSCDTGVLMPGECSTTPVCPVIAI